MRDKPGNTHHGLRLIAIQVSTVLLGTLAVILAVTVGIRSSSSNGWIELESAALTPAAEARSIKGEESAGRQYAQMAVQFRKAARVAAEEQADAHRKGPVDTLRVASERLDHARVSLSSAADADALRRLSSSLKDYSQALIRHRDGLEFESPGAYRQLSDFELKHPSLARIRKHTRNGRGRYSKHRDQGYEKSSDSEDTVYRSLQSAAKHAREAQRLDRAAIRKHARGATGKKHGGVSASMSQLARDVKFARAEMQHLRAEGGPSRPEFPAFAGRAVKGFPYNVMGNLMTAVNAV